jgi:hypothetical protein
MLNKACSTGAEVDGLQDATSENRVERAKVSQREPHRGPVEPGEYHPRSVSDFHHAVLFLRKILSKGSGGDFRQMLMFRDCENLCLGPTG